MSGTCVRCGGPMLALFTSVVCRDTCERRTATPASPIDAIMSKLNPEQREGFALRFQGMSGELYLWFSPFMGTGKMTWHCWHRMTQTEIHEAWVIATVSADRSTMRVTKNRYGALTLDSVPDWVAP